jgi:alpha-tubulin suppressor-like RCC1 family protein
MSESFNKSRLAIFFIACILLSLLVFTAGCVFLSPPVNDSPNNGSPRFTAVSSFGGAGLALRSDGKIVCWGWNENGICDIPQNLTDVKSISNMNYAIKKDGTVAGWGSPYLNPVVPSNLSGVAAITKSQYWNLALKGDGTVVAWKSSSTPELSKPASDAQLAITANQS